MIDFPNDPSVPPLRPPVAGPPGPSLCVIAADFLNGEVMLALGGDFGVYATHELAAFSEALARTLELVDRYRANPLPRPADAD